MKQGYKSLFGIGFAVNTGFIHDLDVTPFLFLEYAIQAPTNNMTARRTLMEREGDGGRDCKTIW